LINTPLAPLAEDSVGVLWHFILIFKSAKLQLLNYKLEAGFCFLPIKQTPKKLYSVPLLIITPFRIFLNNFVLRL